MTKMNTQRICFSIASLIGIVAAFLPWATVNIGVTKTILGIDFDYLYGWYSIALFAVILFLSLLGNRATPLNFGFQIISSALALIIIVNPTYDYFTFKSSMTDIESGLALVNIDGPSISMEIGFYITVLMALTIIILSIGNILKIKNQPR